MSLKQYHMVARTTSPPRLPGAPPSRGGHWRHFTVCLHDLNINTLTETKKQSSSVYQKMSDEHAAPLFRANKRRKVLRKRPDSDDQDDEHAVPATINSDRERGQTPINGSSMEFEEDDATPKIDLSRMRKPKKHGIAFSSSDRPTYRPQDENQETSLVVAEPQALQEANNRFARPTGKAIVQDDKHMYVCHSKRKP